MTPTSRAGTSSNRAFTLIELIVVIFIVSITAALVFPVFSTIGQSALKQDAKKAASILRYVNDAAVARKKTLPVKFNLGEGTISWKTEDDVEKTEELGSMKNVRVTSRGTVGEGELIVFFGPSGAGEDITMRLEEGGRGFTVLLSRISGRVRIIEDAEKT